MRIDSRIQDFGDDIILLQSRLYALGFAVDSRKALAAAWEEYSQSRRCSGWSNVQSTSEEDLVDFATDFL